MKKDVAVSSAMPLEQYLSASSAGQKFNLVLLAGFAAFAVLLAVISVYGVMAHSVILRARELGIRLALGAQRSDVLLLVLREGLIVTFAGVAAGLLAAAAASPYLSELLFRIEPLDPATFLAVAAVQGSAGLLASAVPARRACGIGFSLSATQ